MKDMKKILKIVVLPLIFSLIAISCEIDNYEGPDAKITGRFLDSKTGELVGTDITNGNSIGAYELGWDSESRQNWVIKNNGEYTNNLVFASTYRLEFSNCNFFPFTVENFVIKKGENEHDFTVTPFIRVTNPAITYDAATKTVKATFGLEAGGDNIKLNEIRLFAFTDHWVGNYVKFAISGSDCYKRASANQVGSTIGTDTYTLTMNVDANSALFKYSRNYYFRIGALATVSGVGTVRHNYSPLVVLPIER